jgi:hypothetical protein
MACKHAQVSYKLIIKKKDGVHMAHLTAHCSECKAPFIFLGAAEGFTTKAPTTDQSGQELRLPMMVPAARPMRCSRCHVRLFGAPVGDAPPLDRPGRQVEKIECGPAHVVHYTDGVVLEVANGQITQRAS